MAEFLASLDRNIVLGLGQAAAAIVLCFGVVMLCRRFAVHLERETVISLAREQHPREASSKNSKLQGVGSAGREAIRRGSRTSTQGVGCKRAHLQGASRRL
jgi:hypothetical protein